MALVLYDRVQETTSTTGTGSITLAGAVSGYQSFAVVGNGNTTYYTILNGTQWEVGIGTYSTTGPTLARTTILSNSNGNTSPINLSGASNVWCDYPAEKSVNLDANGNANISYTPNTTTSVGKLNVGDNTYSQSLTGQIAIFAGADTISSNIYLVNTNNTSNTAYSSIVTGANNYASIYMEMGTNSSLYSYSAAGYANNALNQPNNSFLQAYGSDLVLSTWTSNAIHFVQNASSATSDSMTLFADGGASLGGLGDPGIGNIAINNAVVGFTSITSAAGTTVLTSSSTQVQAVTGSTTQTIQLPQATTLLKGTFYTISNASSGLVTVKDNAGTTLETIPSGGAAQFLCIANGTSAGTWGIRVFAASNTTWGNTALNYTGNITGATWQGNTIAYNYGGTGLTTFTAANNALYSTSASALTAGTLPVAAGGTGATTLTGYVYGNGTSAMTASTTIPTSALSGNFVSTFSAGTTGFTPSTATTGAVTLAGTLGVGNGGTGLSSTPTNGQIDIGNGTGFTRSTITGTASQVTVTNSAGGITLSLPSPINVNTSGSAGSVTNAVTFNNGGAGAASGTTYNGSGAVTVSYNTIGAQVAGTYVTSVTGTSPVSSSGGTTPAISLASGYGDTQNPYASKTANYFLAAPNGSAGAPTFRAVVAADIPTLNQNTTGTASNVTGTVAVANGGTGATSASAALTNLGAYAASNPSNYTSNTLTAGTGISVSASTGASTITNTGVTSIVAGTGISVSGSTGSVTISSTASGATITGTTSNTTYYVVGTSSTSGTLSTASISNTNVVSYNASTGALSAVSHVSSSDERLKTDWVNLSTDFVDQLADVKHGTFQRISSGDREVGVTAQSLKEILPEAVVADEEGYMSVNYGAAALVAAIELAKEVKALRAEIAALKAK